MDNKTLVERVFQLKEAIKQKNAPLASQIARAVIPLLEYKGTLETATEKELSSITGVGLKNANYFIRVFRGEQINEITKDVPLRIIPRTPRREGYRKDTDNWDGSNDNATRIYEGG